VSVPFDVRQVLAWTGGRLVRGPAEAVFRGLSIDTRSLGGDALLFAAIRGPRHDAHDFLEAALDAGAAGLLVDRTEALPAALPPALPVVAVADTTRGLGDLAAGHRRGFGGPVVAITGSNGKTTTKEMCAAILDGLGPCLRNRGNLNNAYGLPLTLLEREDVHRTLVVELGMNHRGEIARLAEIAAPTVGVVTNVGTAHIENLGSREAIAAEKGDLVAALAPDGIAVLNADDPRVMAQAARVRARIRSFGRAPGADVRAEALRDLGADGSAFTLCAPEGRVAVRVAGLGAPTVANALAAAAAALAAGAGLDDVAAGLSRAGTVGHRMERVALPGDAVLVDDTYNANPQSTEAALRSVAALKGPGRALVVLGDMGELGREAPRAHRAAGALAAELGVDHLFALGEHAPELAAGALGAGMDPSRVHVVADHEAAARGVASRLRDKDWVLVKGSRSMRMERVVEALVAPAERG
jgi:UDP-N-acetylmuramoyl-tripeptide--D-alanyl-D-alanine ligase